MKIERTNNTNTASTHHRMKELREQKVGQPRCLITSKEGSLIIEKILRKWSDCVKELFNNVRKKCIRLKNIEEPEILKDEVR